MQMHVQLIEDGPERHGWFVEIEPCGSRQYRYLLVEQIDHANRVYASEPYLLFPEMYIALLFAIDDMKHRLHAQLEL